MSDHLQAKSRLLKIGDTVLVQDYRSNQHCWTPSIIYPYRDPRTYTVETNEEVLWNRHTAQLVNSNIQTEIS